MDKKNDVAVALVTYNRKELLIECLNGLLKQTKKPDAVYIIDNASTDKTSEFLLEHHFIETSFPENLSEPWTTSKVIDGILFNYVRMIDNTGGAGGFHEGMKRAYKDGYDWIWLMDDDVEPKNDALEKLLEYETHSLCLHPSREYNNSQPVFSEIIICPTTGKRIDLKDLSFKNGKEICYINTACFEGMLIHRSIVSKIGFPDPRFFIVYDDTTYGVLASQYTNVAYVKNALLYKKINKEEEPLSPFFIYHSVRNYRLRQKYIAFVYGNNLMISIMPYVVTIAYLIKILGYKGDKKAYLGSIWKGFLASFDKKLASVELFLGK